MGAIFAMFAGFYYWIPKIIGNTYNELLGKIHFWSLFIGVNLTFFPMHFLGLAGMPRRIPDYPDAYAYFNKVASFGSLLSFFGIIFFHFIIYIALYRTKVGTHKILQVFGIKTRLFRRFYRMGQWGLIGVYVWRLVNKFLGWCFIKPFCLFSYFIKFWSSADRRRRDRISR